MTSIGTGACFEVVQPSITRICMVFRGEGDPGGKPILAEVVNKIELAEHVEVDLEQMRRDTKDNRGDLPFIFGSMRKGVGVPELADFLKTQGGLH